jgi:hypothetical protein
MLTTLMRAKLRDERLSIQAAGVRVCVCTLNKIKTQTYIEVNQGYTVLFLNDKDNVDQIIINLRQLQFHKSEIRERIQILSF